MGCNTCMAGSYLSCVINAYMLCAVSNPNSLWATPNSCVLLQIVQLQITSRLAMELSFYTLPGCFIT